MKTTVIMAVLSFTAYSATAQKLKETEVPTVVKESFAKKYPGTKAEKWEKEGTDFEVKFDLGKVESEAIFDASGVFKALEQEVSSSTLPKEASDYCAKNLTDYKLSEVEKITNASGAIQYKAEMKKGKENLDVIFDETGKFLSKEKDNY